MKPALLGLVLGTTIAAVMIASSCSITHRSGDYACTKQSDCNGSRQCVDGFCIVPGSIDAPRLDGRPGGDSNNCPAPCTSCNPTLKTCTVDCKLTGACNGTVTCPTGYKCDIQCDVDNACRSGINCQLGQSCSIECSGTSSCRNVQCGGGPCDVSCSGPGSCRGISCGTSCACDVVCTGNQSCTDTIQCTSIACDNGSGCTSVPAFCHTCP